VISKKTTDELAAWMSDVTEYGTAIKARDGQIGGTAGKTGTPQVSGDPRSGEYGWFAGFFPQDSPRYVIVVMSKEEGGADDVAVPLFHDIARSIWLNKILKK
jgi:cell division protein FtsI/penicillin-binding protein 2